MTPPPRNGGPCAHPNATPWRAEYVDPYGHRGPEATTTGAGERLCRSWATCLDCGVRLERGLVAR